jgi:hypothetical protein
VKIDIDEFQRTAVSEKLAYAIDIVINVLDAYEQINKKIIFIIDQINELDDYGFKFLSELLKCDKCIISASANNLQEIDSKQNFRMHYLTKITPKFTFSPDEFKVFYPMLSHYRKLKGEAEQNPKLDFDEDDLAQIMLITGGIPIELFHFIKQLTIKGSLADWIENYTFDFNHKRYKHSHLQNWYTGLSDQDKRLAIENVSRIIRGLSLGSTDNNDVYDRRIVFQDAKDKQIYLRAINPIALNCLKKFFKLRSK